MAASHSPQPVEMMFAVVLAHHFVVGIDRSERRVRRFVDVDRRVGCQGGEDLDIENRFAFSVPGQVEPVDGEVVNHQRMAGAKKATVEGGEVAPFVRLELENVDRLPGAQSFAGKQLGQPVRLGDLTFCPAAFGCRTVRRRRGRGGSARLRVEHRAR